jgi:hypothetical protein
MSNHFTLNTVLRRRQDLFSAILDGSIGESFLLMLIVFSLIVIGVYGFVIGTFVDDFSVWLRDSQSLIVTIVASFILCIPSLYIFSALRGSDITVRQLLGVSVVGLATLALVLLGFLPVAWFFTWVSDAVEFVRIMNSVIIGIAIIMHIVVIAKGLSAAYARAKTQGAGAREGLEILGLWAIVYAVVTVQMAMQMEPFFSK